MPTVMLAEPVAVPPENPSKAAAFRRLLLSDSLSFLMEAHDGLSAKVVQEAGFEAIWASDLAISTALGVRDRNEVSWTQILDDLEFMSEAASIPILLDGDTSYGDFNNFRRLVRKLEQRSIAADGRLVRASMLDLLNRLVRARRGSGGRIRRRALVQRQRRSRSGECAQCAVTGGALA